jgi:uncharacterized membrane protein YcaP (DUF421 family)
MILRIALRALFAYLFLQVLVRISGKKTVQQGTVLDFVVVLVVGDMADDAIWGELAVTQFVVAAATLFGVHTGLKAMRASTPDAL